MSTEPLLSEPVPRGAVTHGVLLWRLTPLVDRPGESEMVITGTRNLYDVATRMRIGKTQIPVGRWEFVTRRLDVPVGADTYGLWARYLGPLEAEEPVPVRRPVDPLKDIVELEAPDVPTGRVRNLRSVGQGRVR